MCWEKKLITEYGAKVFWDDNVQIRVLGIRVNLKRNLFQYMELNIISKQKLRLLLFFRLLDFKFARFLQYCSASQSDFVAGCNKTWTTPSC